MSKLVHTMTSRRRQITGAIALEGKEGMTQTI
jgi:hypothetical protein